MTKDVKEMTADEIRERVLLLGFAETTTFHVVLQTTQRLTCQRERASLCVAAGTNKKWDDGRPFDADGKGTSDLDLTLVGKR